MRLALSMIPVLAIACVESQPPDPQGTSVVARFEYPVLIPPALDVLFVIDSSPAMAAHRERLDTTLPAVIAEMVAELHGVPDLHLGVVTADTGGDGCEGPGDGGLLRSSARVDGSFLVDRPSGLGTRERNYTGELVDTVRELVDAGTEGCAVARPLEALHLALTRPENQGFFRDDAYLAVVFVTANDDASPSSIEDYIAATRSAVPHPGKLILAPFSGDETGSRCGEEPAPRLLRFIDTFLVSSVHTSICSDDVSNAASGLASFYKQLLSLPCWQVPLFDADPATPGLQPVCEAWLTSPSIDASGDASIDASGDPTLSPCPDEPSENACYRIVPAPGCTPPGDGHALYIEGVFSLPREPTIAIVECLADPPR